MVDILHRVGATVSPADVYAALTTTDGLAGWWTEDTKAEGDAGEVGGIIRFRFAGAPEPAGFDMLVRDLRPGERVKALRSGSAPRSPSTCPRRTNSPS